MGRGIAQMQVLIRAHTAHTGHNGETEGAEDTKKYHKEDGISASIE
jgi:hypothetical protein